LQTDQIFEKFEKIEQKVQELLEIRQNLEKEILDHKGYISELERELQEKVEAEKHYIEEKQIVRDKVDGLLRKLNVFTQNTDNTEA
jgi:predicted  nucleic acid-binding Zn-ribbon protein